MTMYLILFGLIILLGAAVFILIVIIKDDNKRIKELKADNKILSDNITSLVKYSDLVCKIKNEKEEVYNELLQAQDGEEICEIIMRIISNNNNRVSNS